MTINVGEIIEKLLTEKYNDIQFSYRYDYINIFDKHLNNFLNNMTEYITIIETEFLIKLKNIYDIFIDIYNTSSIDAEQYMNIKNNYTICSNLNESLFEDKYYYEEILLDCEKNNYYNYSVKIYTDYNDEFKIKFNQIINQINNINNINLSYIILSQYYEENYILDDYTLTQEQLEDIFYKLFLAYDDIILYINYTQNNIYSEHIYSLLIDSFNSSYTNYINNYLIFPLIDNVTLYIKNNANIHLNYLINKIKDEFDYYSMMLNFTKELGKNSKQSLSDLYDYLNNKINEYIDNNIKNYVLFYLDIFYKTNKYIFRDNYINYYANELNEYGITIHQIKDIINEIIYDTDINKTLNIYSNELFNELIYYKLNNSLNELLFNQLNKVHTFIDELNSEMNNLLYNITINEENTNIINIINNYQILLFAQNNNFIFKVSEAPLEQLYYFIQYILKPPISEIKEHYNIIEVKILEKIINITDNFPDFSLIIKEKLRIYDILELISELIEQLRYLLLKYENDLNTDYDNYINKLIHYTYINGLISFEKPCNSSFCVLNISEIKSQINISNITNNIKNNNTINSSNKYINNKNNSDNKNINNYINNLRTLSQMEFNYDYDETKGAISKDDIILFLADIQKSIFDLNKTYINNFDLNAKLKTEKFIIKVNGTYKAKLKNLILKSASKFSPILSRESYQQLIDNMFKQYYKIEYYLNNNTLLLQNDINKLISILTNSSIFIKTINDLSYNKILGYFDILIEMIQDKYELINDNNKYHLRNLEEETDDDIDSPNELNELDKQKFDELFKETKNKGKKYFVEFITTSETFKDRIEGLLVDIVNNGITKVDFSEVSEFETSITLILYKNKISKLNFAQSIQINLFSLKIDAFCTLFPTFPFLQLRIVPELHIGLNFEMGFEMDFLEDDYTIYYDISGEAEVSVSVEVGFYYPVASKTVEISLTMGLKGILGSGSVGLKFSLCINKAEFETEVYYKYKAFTLSFYIMFRIQIKMKFMKFSFSFYLINKRLCKGITEKKSKSLKFKLKKIAKFLH